MQVQSPHIIFTVTNDLVYDRRMDRVCNTLAAKGFKVTLAGRKFKTSLPLPDKPYRGVRLGCWFNQGFLFYAEYNLRLFFWLLKTPFAVACACDLDTALPVKVASWLKGRKSVLDAHEYFTESPEIVNRPAVKAVWEWIGSLTIPRFHLRYTVGEELAHRMSEKYKVPFYTIRNIAPEFPLSSSTTDILQREKIILYPGTLNIGRGLEVLMEAMKQLPGWKLWLAGEGDISIQLRMLSKQYGLTDRVQFLGWVLPGELPELMQKVRIGINLRERGSLNDYYSLPNKFFDFIHAGLPSVQMNYPEYAKVGEKYPCALFLNEMNVENILDAIRSLDQYPQKLKDMVEACHRAAKEFTWEKESIKLAELYRDLMTN